MTDLETRLRELDLPEPPLGFDTDEVADRAAAKARTRAAGIAGTVLALVAVVFLVASGPASVPPARSLVPPSAAEQSRIRQALFDAVTRLFPGARELSVGTSSADSVSPGRMNVTADFVDGTGHSGDFQLTVRSAGADYQVVPADRLCPRPGPEQHCVRVSQPGGAVLVLSGLDYTDGMNSVIRGVLNGFLYRPDGSTVMVLGGRGQSLTEEQLTKVITDPAFVLL